jgi:hypothetical protein
MKYFSNLLQFAELDSAVSLRMNSWREKRLEMALIQISVPARENYRVIKGF